MTINFTRDTQEALLKKVGVPIDKINENRQEIPEKELNFS